MVQAPVSPEFLVIQATNDLSIALAGTKVWGFLTCCPGSFCRDILSLGITVAEHQQTLLGGIQALRAQVIRMHGRGVQV